jgi:hypothetical protein
MGRSEAITKPRVFPTVPRVIMYRGITTESFLDVVLFSDLFDSNTLVHSRNHFYCCKENRGHGMGVGEGVDI